MTTPVLLVAFISAHLMAGAYAVPVNCFTYNPCVAGGARDEYQGVIDTYGPSARFPSDLGEHAFAKCTKGRSCRVKTCAHPLVFVVADQKCRDRDSIDEEDPEESNCFQLSGEAEDEFHSEVEFGSLDGMTNELCAANCENWGYKVSGTGYGLKCYCGNGNPDLFVPSDDCTEACTGADDQICGGVRAISVTVIAGGN